MRRLEQVEGKSSKFWEIELQGSGFTVRWGRIGTSGQTQQKSFPHVAKAQSEHDKLLAEKLKKGYVEVGGASSAPAAPVPAAAPAPVTPAPAPAAPVTAGPVFWSEALLKRVHPRRGGVRVPVRALHSASEAWRAVRTLSSKAELPMAQLQKHSGDLSALVHSIASRLARTEPSLGTPEEDAALLALLQRRRDWKDSPNITPLVDLLLSLGGPAHATQAVLGSVEMHVSRDTSFTLLRGLDPHYLDSLQRNPRGLPRLRALLATHVDEAGYLAARDAASRLRLTDAQRSAAAFLFPTESDWVQAEAQAFIRKDAKFEGILCALSNRDTLALVAPHVSTYSLGYGEVDYLPSVLDGAGLDALVLLREFKPKLNGTDTRRLWAEALSALDSDEALGHLLDVPEKEVLAQASEAIQRWPERALRVLAPRAAVRGKAAEVPRALLASVVRRVPHLVAAEAARLPEEARKVLEELTQQSGPQVPDAPAERIPRALLSAPTAKLPAFFSPESLPAPLLAGRAEKLPTAAVRELGALLTSVSDPSKPPSGVLQVREACDKDSLARFAWALFEAWLLGGAANKESWAFKALGALGDDACARKLEPLIRQWPGEAAHARAVVGLEVLAAIGTDVTLIYLNGIAEKVKFKGLQGAAQAKIAQLAEARGLTRDELADRLVPDLGLDESGSLRLDFGERTFTVGFDEQLKPYVKDAEGARLKDLPKPTKKDDAEKAKASEERWKALKKDAKAAASTQVLRLELGMCGKRRWSVDVFQRFFVAHPLLIHVVRRLVWATYDAKDTLLTTFRVAEDRTFADAREDVFELPAGARVGLPHPLELDAPTAAAWGQVLADYQLIQPFAQLGRPTYAPTPEERKAKDVTRVEGFKVPTGKVLGLTSRGWLRGPPQDAGVVCWMEKHLPAGRTVIMDLDPGLFTGYLSESPEQTLGKVSVRTDGSHWDDKGKVALGELDAILFSELMRDLEGLRA